MGEALDRSVTLLHDMTGCSPDAAREFIKSLVPAIEDAMREERSPQSEQNDDWRQRTDSGTSLDSSNKEPAASPGDGQQGTGEQSSGT